jgi:hypothetical protein
MDGTRVSTPVREETTSAAVPATGQLGVGRQAWHFARHYLEMCAAMCIGGVLLNTLVFAAGPALVGYPDLRQYYPGLALVLAAVLFTLPMAAWMRIRGMAWRPRWRRPAPPSAWRSWRSPCPASASYRPAACTPGWTPPARRGAWS